MHRNNSMYLSTKQADECFKHLAERFVELNSNNEGSLMKKTAFYVTGMKANPSAPQNRMRNSCWYSQALAFLQIDQRKTLSYCEFTRLKIRWTMLWIIRSLKYRSNKSKKCPSNTPWRRVKDVEVSLSFTNYQLLNYNGRNQGCHELSFTCTRARMSSFLLLYNFSAGFLNPYVINMLYRIKCFGKVLVWV